MDQYNRMQGRGGQCGCNTGQQRNMMRQMRRTDEMERSSRQTGKMRDDLPVGMAYVPWQEWGEMYEVCKGFREGTMFPELNLIFCGIRGTRR